MYTELAKRLESKKGRVFTLAAWDRLYTSSASSFAGQSSPFPYFPLYFHNFLHIPWLLCLFAINHSTLQNIVFL